jgi:molybdate transport system substrate-binding protein
VTATALQLLSAGAAQGLVRALEPRLHDEHGITLAARFGAVGAMRALFDGGQPCDVLILTDALLRELAAAGAVRGATQVNLGRVRTGIAVRRGTPPPDVATTQALREALLAADEVYFPDPERATAGIHFMKVLRTLGIDEALRERLRPHPNGATAMRELAAATSARPIGCTQVTEILYTAGVGLVAPLPPAFELATVYGAALATRCRDAAQAQRFVQALVADDTRALREAGGFESV